MTQRASRWRIWWGTGAGATVQGAGAGSDSGTQVAGAEVRQTYRTFTGARHLYVPPAGFEPATPGLGMHCAHLHMPRSQGT